MADTPPWGTSDAPMPDPTSETTQPGTVTLHIDVDATAAEAALNRAALSMARLEIAQLTAEVDRLTPPSSWRVSPDGHGTPTLWDTAGNPETWEVLTDACQVPPAVWNWITAVVPTLEPEREGDPAVVTATASMRSNERA